MQVLSVLNSLGSTIHTEDCLDVNAAISKGMRIVHSYLGGTNSFTGEIVERHSGFLLMQVNDGDRSARLMVQAMSEDAALESTFDALIARVI